MKNRLFSLFLAFCMTLTLIPFAYADAQFTVTFNPEGGSVSPKTKTVTNGQAYGELPTPARSGYDFIGWYTEPSGGLSDNVDGAAVKIEADTIVNLTADQTLYAYWQEVLQIFTVTFNPEGGSVSPKTKTVTNAQPYGELPTPARSGYDFIGWYTEPSGGLSDNVDGAAVKIEADTIVNLTGDQTLYAYWQEALQTFTVTFNPEGGSVSPNAKTVTNGLPYGELPAPERSGYAFIGWYTEPSGGLSDNAAVKIEADTVVNLTADQTLYAYWQEITETTFTVTFNPEGGSVSPNAKTVTNGQAYGELPTPQRSGYAFIGWYTEPSGGLSDNAAVKIEADTVVNLTADQTLYAYWQEAGETFTVTFDASGGSVSKKTKTVTNGEPYGAFPTANKQGFALIGWFTKPEGEGDAVKIEADTIVNLTADQTLYAHWGQQYTVTFKDEGRTVTPSEMIVTNGDTYGPLPETEERSGYVFLGWFDALSGGTRILSSSIVNLTADQTLYARWQDPEGNEITVHFAGNGGSASPESKYVMLGQPYGALPVPVRYGYDFAGWHTDAKSGAEITETSIVADDAIEHTLYAHWTLKPGFVEVTLYANGGKFSDGSTESVKVVANRQPYGTLPKYPQEIFRSEDSSGQYDFWGWHTESLSDTSGKTPVKETDKLEADGNASQLYAIWTNIDPVPPTVTTNRTDDSKVTENSAPLSGTVNHPGSSPVTKRQIVYWNKHKPSSRYIVNGTGEGGDFGATVNGFSPASTYYYYAKAENGVGEGVGNVYALTTKGKENPLPVSVSVSPSQLTLTEGDSSQLVATVLPNDAGVNRNVIWSSGDSAVATVDQSGKVTAVKAGETEIIATTEANRLTARCKLTVIEEKKDDPPVSGAFDFSEANMATNVANCAPDGFDYGEGGNARMATAYLARWDGPVMEEDDPYPSYYSGNPSDYYKEIAANYHVQEILWIPARASSLDNDEYKAAIMNYGAVYAAFVVDWSCFDSADKNYYYPESRTGGAGGHAVAAVGWDDDYPASNFPIKPPGNGAFICRNSWGTGSGENGYFYISYYDKWFGVRNGGGMVIPSVEAKTNYNTIYQYDPLGAVGACLANGATSSMYSANVFPDANSKLKGNEILRAAAFYTYAKNTSYEIYVVSDYKNSDSLKSLGSAVASGAFEDMGYHTVKFKESVSLKAGTRFAVVVKLTVTDGKSYAYIEYPEYNYSSKARANADESYMSADGKSWTDLTTEVDNANFCIKAFTDNQTGAAYAALFSAIDNDTREYASDKTYSLDEALDAGILISDEYIQWQRGASLLDGNEVEENLGDVPSPVVIADNAVSFVEGAIFPKKYDLRTEKCVTDVRDQHNWGSCWAFAAYSSLESCLLKKAKSLSSDSLDHLPSPSLATDFVTALVNAINRVVTESLKSLKLNLSSMTMAVNAERQLSAIAESSDATETDASDVLWYSSDESVAIVDTNGTVTAKGTGKAVITAKLADGSLTSSCNVTVNEGKSVTGIQLAQESVTQEVGTIFLVDYTVLPEDAANKAVTWSSDNPDAVQANPTTGAMMVLKAEKTVITVTTQDGQYSAKLTVNPVGDEPDVLPGDVNNDGKISVRDVGLIQQSILGWDLSGVDFVERAADVNADNKISVRDVGLIQQFILGWDVTLLPPSNGG